jgi:hypothetical protein
LDCWGRTGPAKGLLAKAQFEALSDKFVDTQWMTDQVDLWRADITKASEANALDADQARLCLDAIDSLGTLLADVNEEAYGAGLGGDMLDFASLDVSREREGPNTPFQITFPQVLLRGSIGCTAAFAISIVKERASGTFDRLRIGPI